MPNILDIESDPETGNGRQKEYKNQNEETSRQTDWRTGGGPWGTRKSPRLSPFWRTLLLEIHKNDGAAIEHLQESMYTLGYNEGFSRVSRLIVYFF